MPNFTKQAIKETFLRQLSQRPLSKITVKDIVEECGINRNSFYYHFEDLPALVEDIVAERVSELVERHPTIDSVEQCFDTLVEFVMQNKRAIYNVYNSMSRDIFERYLMELCGYIVTAYVKPSLAGQPEADVAAVIRYHKCACFGTVIDWLNGGMDADIAAYFRRICQLRLGWPERAAAGGPVYSQIT